MNRLGLISVIVPVYNCSRYLSRCLDSIIAQSYSNYEAIIIDDGSTDGSGRICDCYASHDNRFKIIHKKNEGVSKGRIEGYLNSQGDYITFVDSDDYIHPDAFVTLIKDLQVNNVDVAVCSNYVVRDNRLSKSQRAVEGFYDKVQIRELVKTNLLYDSNVKKSGFPLYLWGKLYKREVLVGKLECGEGFWYGEDILIMISLLKAISNLFVNKAPLYYYVENDGQATRKNPVNLYEGYMNLWMEIEKKDIDSDFIEQLPLRMSGFIKQLLQSQLTRGGYKTYVHLYNHIVNQLFKKKKVLLYADWKPKLWLTLLKSGNPKYLYFFYKLKLLIQK